MTVDANAAEQVWLAPLPTPTIDGVLAAVSRRGLRVNNLFQLESGPWRANLTDGKTWFEFGTSETAVGALEEALGKAAVEVDVFS